MNFITGLLNRKLQNFFHDDNRLEWLPMNSAAAMANVPAMIRRLIPECMNILVVCFILALFGCTPVAPPQTTEPPQAASVVPAGPVNVHVDHAWVKDADTADEQAAQTKVMEALRAKIVAGGAFITSWNSLGVDPTLWHVAEAETYPADVLPESVRNLPVGSISPIVPGDGGLHLIRILGREAAE